MIIITETFFNKILRKSLELKNLKILKFSNSLIQILPFVFLMNSCGIYSFSGASIAPDVKTVTINYFPSYAPLAKPITSQLFTEALKDIFNSQTNLKLVNQNGDLLFDGSIIDYNTSPIAIQGNEIAARNRLTITVSVKFTNSKDPSQNFESTFSRFSDYSSSQNLSSVENGLITEINSFLVQDIFNRSVSNW